MITLTLRGAMVRRPGCQHRGLTLEPAIADALPLFDVDVDALSEELAMQFDRETRGMAAAQRDEISVVVRFPLDPPGPPAVTFGEGLPLCEQCQRLLGPEETRWCDACADRCELCGRPAGGMTPGDCPEHAAALADVEDGEARRMGLCAMDEAALGRERIDQ